MLAYGICFSLSDLLHSVSQSFLEMNNFPYLQILWCPRKTENLQFFDSPDQLVSWDPLSWQLFSAAGQPTFHHALMRRSEIWRPCIGEKEQGKQNIKIKSSQPQADRVVTGSGLSARAQCCVGRPPLSITSPNFRRGRRTT